MDYNNIHIKRVGEHVEVFSITDGFLFSEDNFGQAMKEIDNYL